MNDYWTMYNVVERLGLQATIIYSGDKEECELFLLGFQTGQNAFGCVTASIEEEETGEEDA